MDEINVVYAADDHYAHLAGVSMLSLFENNKHCNKINAYILADNISEANKERLREIGRQYKREVRLIDMSHALENLKQMGVNKYGNEWKGHTAYSRLFIPDLIPEKKRFLYIDCDTLIIGDIEELWKLDMRDKPVGLAYDCLQKQYKKFISLDENASYYNSGIMLLEIDRWKQLKCTERILWHITHIRNHYPLADQDFMNVVLKEDIYPLKMKYNYLSQYFLYPYNGLKKVYELQNNCFYREDEYVKPDDAVILHFCGQTFARPWFMNSKHPAKKKYDYYYGLSPWKYDVQKTCKWKLAYKIQYLLWKYSPEFLNVFGGGYNAKNIYAFNL